MLSGVIPPWCPSRMDRTSSRAVCFCHGGQDQPAGLDYEGGGVKMDDLASVWCKSFTWVAVLSCYCLSCDSYTVKTVFFSAIHTFIILYAPYRQGGISWTRAYWTMYNKPSNFFNSKGLMVNGTFALAALSWIVISSFAKIRNWYV